MKTVENFILGLDGQQKAIVSFLHQKLAQTHDLIPKIRYNIPFYYRKSWVCYLNPLKNDGVELVFLKGQELSNEQGLLDKKDRKMVAGISIMDTSFFENLSLDAIIQEAIILDELK